MKLIFKSRILTDFQNQFQTELCTIDDFSGIFNNNARTTPYADVYRNRLSQMVEHNVFVLVFKIDYLLVKDRS